MALRPKEQYLALHAARANQKTAEFQKEYNVRAGIEGTLSEGIHRGECAVPATFGKAKTHLQNVAIATALNIYRLVAWIWEVPRAATRKSSFARFCAQGAAAVA